MKKLLSPFLLAWVLVTAGCATTLHEPDQSTKEPVKAFGGIWYGSFSAKGLYADGSTLETDNKLEIFIQNGNFHIFSYIPEDKQWEEVKPGLFKATFGAHSAVLYAMDTGRDHEGSWEEVWALTITLRNEHEMLVEWSRVVKNPEMSFPNKYSSFGFGGVGILRKVQ